MGTWILFLLLGLATGALYAALAQGVILVYQGSGVVNFALGAMAMIPAITYAELRNSGDLILLLPGRNRVSLGESLGFAPACLIALTVGSLVTVLAYLVIFRPLRNAPPLTIVVATVGLTIVLQGLAAMAFGTATVRTPHLLPDTTTQIFGRAVPVDRFYMAGIAVLAGLAMAIVYRSTKFGLLTRAAAENSKGAILLGYNERWVALANMIIASLISGFVGILVTSLAGVNPFNYALFVVPALAAALAGRLRGFGVATTVALLIGAFEALTVHLIASEHIPNFLLGGFSALVPFLVIVVALIMVGKSLPDRSFLHDRSQVIAPLPNMSLWIWVLSLAVAVSVAGWGDQRMTLALIQTCFVIVLLLSWVVVTGYVGQASLAQLACAGFAAFTLARIERSWGLSFPYGALVAIAITTVLGVVIALPALRIRGVQFTIVTLAAAVVFEQVLFRSPFFIDRSGLTSVDPPSLLGIDLAILVQGERFPRRAWAFASVGFVLIASLVVANLRRSATGRRFVAVRMNERAAAAAGINVMSTKLAGAAFGSAIAGLAGVMFAYKSQGFSGAGLEATVGLQYLALAYLGGIGSISGAVIGGVIAPAGLLIVALSSAEPSNGLYLTTGLALIAVTRWLPGGLADVLRMPRRLIDKNRDRAAAEAVTMMQESGVPDVTLRPSRVESNTGR